MTARHGWFRRRRPPASLTRAATAETTVDPSSVMTLLADHGTDGSELTSYRSTFAKGAVGAPAHFHTRASGMFFVMDGALQVLVDDEVKALEKGDYLRLLGRVMRGEAGFEEIKNSSELYDNHYVDSPVWQSALQAAK
ncbi:cupin domain-containing protein [Streptomyces sp. NPDC059009]|uniref:cupin domain-containing protein n=1 Tax=Streptomyces sp. NPDC059009 TaxID=3346694 RepID=UPI0036A78CA2